MRVCKYWKFSYSQYLFKNTYYVLTLIPKNWKKPGHREPFVSHITFMVPGNKRFLSTFGTEEIDANQHYECT